VGPTKVKFVTAANITHKIFFLLIFVKEKTCLISFCKHNFQTDHQLRKLCTLHNQYKKLVYLYTLGKKENNFHICIGFTHFHVTMLPVFG